MSFPDPFVLRNTAGGEITTLTRVGNGTPTTSLYRGSLAGTAFDDRLEMLIRQTSTKTRTRTEFRISTTRRFHDTSKNPTQTTSHYLVIDRPLADFNVLSDSDTVFIADALKGTLNNANIGKLLNGEL